MKFDKPIEIDDATYAFPADVKHLMPDREDVPREFEDFSSDNPFVKLQQKWFFGGLDTSILVAKKGIDKKTALRHLSAIQGSWEPKHEHKVAAVSYLMSLWFELPKKN
jgi:hypothetical protein